MNTEIVIVEDEGLIALELKKKLERAGYTVVAVADNAADAMLCVERLRPSLVLMDIRLRGPQDGVETGDQIRRQFHVPVIFVTAHADRETLDRAKITEPFGYIVKPFHSVDFRAQIEMALWKHKMEEKLRVSEAWLSTTFRNVADGLIATGSDGNIAFMNQQAADLTGWDSTEAKGQPLLDVFRVLEEETGLPMVHPLDAIYDGRQLGPRTFNLRKRGGSAPVLVEAELSANRDNGSLLGIIVAFRDISGRRKAERQSRQLQKMDAIALMAISVGTELAELQKRTDGALMRMIAKSEGHTLSLLEEVFSRSVYEQALVHELLRLGRTDAGEPALVDLNSVLTEMEEKFRKALGIRRPLNLRLQSGLPLVKADPHDLRENLLRLVFNARHSITDGGAVEISTATLDSPDAAYGVQVAVRDTGNSIQTNAKERVFDPYFQARPGNRNPGLSLALVYQFVALSGGFIEVESRPPHGTAYLLNFPAAHPLSLTKQSDKSLAASF